MQIINISEAKANLSYLIKTVQETDLDLAGFEALTWVEGGKPCL